MAAANFMTEALEAVLARLFAARRGPCGPGPARRRLRQPALLHDPGRPQRPPGRPAAARGDPAGGCVWPFIAYTAGAPLPSTGAGQLFPAGQLENRLWKSLCTVWPSPCNSWVFHIVHKVFHRRLFEHFAVFGGIMGLHKLYTPGYITAVIPPGRPHPPASAAGGGPGSGPSPGTGP